MKKIELQDFIFKKNLSRRELVEYESGIEKKYLIQIYRNHSFELVENTIAPYLDYAGLGVEFKYSSYDDSLSFLDINLNADAIILWLDAGRYEKGIFKDFIIARLNHLKKIYLRPILFIPFDSDVDIPPELALIFSLETIRDKLGEKFIDKRALAVTGTSLSSLALMMISRELGLKYIPNLLKPKLKAVVVDFDNTLYKGVLGEDGIDNLVFEEGHLKLHKALKELVKKGIFLCAASKNELEDVEKLLDKRKDFLLEKDDFTKLCVSWNSKGDSILEISQYINIGIDSMLMIDDNIGEINFLSMLYPELNIIHAKDDADITCDILNNYPGLNLLTINMESLIRKDDIIANEKRNLIKNSLNNKDEYIRSLKIKLNYNLNNRANSMRITELANKTNQFIFNYKRYTLQEIETMFEDEKTSIITISLEDSLSNSGLIAACFAKDCETYISIEECFMSCRALGRGIDDIIVLGAISLVVKKMKKKKILVNFKDGDRNRPAREYVNRYLQEYTKKPADFEFNLPTDLVDIEVME